MLKIFTDYLLRGFKVLIGAPENIPNSFGSSVIKLSPGHEHNLMITPTFIRFELLLLQLLHMNYTNRIIFQF